MTQAGPPAINVVVQRGGCCAGCASSAVSSVLLFGFLLWSVGTVDDISMWWKRNEGLALLAFAVVVVAGGLPWLWIERKRRLSRERP